MAKSLKDIIKVKTVDNKDRDTDSDINTINVDIPTFIRLLEFAREDAKTDEVLHILTEKLIECHANGIEVICMDDYNKIIKELNNKKK